ncbi:MAG: YeeE/YedE thiosulfate transporter family protein [Actinomycetota bacterium]|nr:YeeE/YedE thiosulfate transporter family protein [Actinomycetota bacterium]
MPFPLDLHELGTPLTYTIFVFVGIGFGFMLEQAGFGRSSKLAAQFYFKDFAMFKVMFTAVITAMVLIFGSVAIGILDFRAVFVPGTYLWPIAIGGFILGVGFLIGGLCPGTSIVGAATLKLDAMAFLGGVVFGVFVFGETVPYFMDFWTTSDLGRLTLPDWLGIPTGVVVLVIVVFALLLFWGAEALEKKTGVADSADAPKARYVGAGVLVLLALVVLVIGDPTTNDYWDAIAAEEQPRLDNREVQIHPGELLELMHDGYKNLILLDVRDERDYNQFHLRAAHQVDPTAQAVEDAAPDLLGLDSRTVIVAMSNGEEDATKAWKSLTANDVINVYILEGGVNAWLEIFGEDADPKPTNYPDQPAFVFEAALGGRCVASDPDAHEFHLVYEPKVKIAAAGAVVGGGCG